MFVAFLAVRGSTSFLLFASNVCASPYGAFCSEPFLRPFFGNRRFVLIDFSTGEPANDDANFPFCRNDRSERAACRRLAFVVESVDSIRLASN